MSDMDGYMDPECRDCGLVVCDCPSDLDAPIQCGHGVWLHEFCADCAVAGEMALAGALAKALRRIQEHEDETMGAALAARQGVR